MESTGSDMVDPNDDPELGSKFLVWSYWKDEDGFLSVRPLAGEPYAYPCLLSFLRYRRRPA